jgi:simple sugar transport system permease protein
MSGRANLPWWADYLLIPALNLAAAFAVSAVLLLAIGEDPLSAARIIFEGAFGHAEGLGYTLFYATNFIFTGLAFALAYHAGLFNIGAEGQAYVAGLGVAFVGLYLDFLPRPLIFVLAAAAAAAFGAAWAFVPGYLQARRGSHVVITTIMFNFIAAALIVYLLVNHLSPPGSMQPETRTFASAARLPFLHDILPVSHSPLNLSFLWALACCVFFYVLIWRTKLGFELRTFGANPLAAVYGAMSPPRLIMIAMMLSGSLAGFMALNEILGSQHRMILDYTSGYGFVGIAVALMGRAHPAGIIFAAILFGALYQGGAELAFERPNITRDMIVLLQGLVIMMAGGLEHLFRPQVERLFRCEGHLSQKQGEGRWKHCTPWFRWSTPPFACRCRCCLPALLGSTPSVLEFLTSAWKARC